MIKFFLGFFFFVVLFTVNSFAILLHTFTITKNVEWAKPNGHSLTMDIYVPNTGKTSYPVIVIYHGGGWLTNTNSTMDSMATYIVHHSEYVVCNVNYRLLADENNSVGMNEIIEDAMGALLWIKEHISEYRGDSSSVGLTGDSAGGQLAAMLMLSGKKLSAKRFTDSSLSFLPTYIPKKYSVEEIVIKNLLSVKAVALNYPVVNIVAMCKNKFETRLNIFWTLAQQSPRGIFGDSISLKNNSNYYFAVSPFHNIPQSSKRTLPPQLCIVGSKDPVTTPTSIQEYVAAVKEQRHTIEYWEHKGRSHAFLDSEKNVFLGTEFRKDAPLAIDRIINFFNIYLNNKN